MSRIVILGAGESGCGSAVLAKKQGFDVFVSDMGTIAPKYEAMLRDWEIPYESGKHTAELILNADQVVKSPGIPDKAPMVKSLREIGVPIISEIEFAGRYTDAKTICITGSNGKTTTTTLIYQMLKDAGYNVALAGNIGESFALSVATSEVDWYVIELSSFQLDGMFRFRADIALLMNITPDHLDRYEYKLQNYVDSKFRIIQNQNADDTFIYCSDDPITAENLTRHALGMRTLPFSVKNLLQNGGSKQGDAICVHVPSDGKSLSDSELSISVNDLKIKGIHNTYNVMAASLAALTAGVNARSIERTLREFTGVEHRLEPAGKVDGVEYINDSKATNVDSVWYALESMTRPVIWIAGGTDKGNDYNAIKPLVESKVKALVCMGVDNAKLVDFFGGVVTQIVDTKSLDEAMSAAQNLADEGDVVLLSPACASFDLFKNYEDRGRQFKEWVRSKS